MVNVVNLIKVGLTGVLLLFFLGFWIGTSVVAPEHAMVLIDSNKGVYLAPQCISETQTG